ncbi:hypothetical protein [Streptomyces sp. ODS28]
MTSMWAALSLEALVLFGATSAVVSVLRNRLRGAAAAQTPQG